MNRKLFCAVMAVGCWAVDGMAADFVCGGFEFDICGEGVCELVAPESGEPYTSGIVPSVATKDGEDYVIVSIGEGAFDGSEVEKISLPATIEELGSEAFANCAKLRSMHIQGYTLPYDFISEDDATVVLPPNVEYLPSRLMYGCREVEKIITPEACIGMDSGVFDYCFNMRTLLFGEYFEMYNAVNEGVMMLKTYTASIPTRSPCPLATKWGLAPKSSCFAG